MLSDKETMQYFEKKYDAQKWLYGIFKDYEKYGHSFWAVILKETGKFVGQVGILNPIVEGRQEKEIAYMLNKKSWRKGYASEATIACRDYGFGHFDFERLISMIVPENIPSIGVAKKVGMELERMAVVDRIECCIYSIEKSIEY